MDFSLDEKLPLKCYRLVFLIEDRHFRNIENYLETFIRVQMAFYRIF